MSRITGSYGPQGYPPARVPPGFEYPQQTSGGSGGGGVPPGLAGSPPPSYAPARMQSATANDADARGTARAVQLRQQDWNNNDNRRQQLVAGREASGGLTERQRQYQAQYGDSWQEKYNADDAKERLSLNSQAGTFLDHKLSGMGTPPGLAGSPPAAAPAAPTPGISPQARTIADVAGGMSRSSGGVTPDSITDAGRSISNANAVQDPYQRGVLQDTNDIYGRMGALDRSRATGAPPGLGDRIADANAGFIARQQASQPAPLGPLDTRQSVAQRMLKVGQDSESVYNRNEMGNYRAPDLSPLADTGGPRQQTPQQIDRAGLVSGALASGQTPEQYSANQINRQMGQAQAERLKTMPWIAPDKQAGINMNNAKAGYYNGLANKEPKAPATPRTPASGKPGTSPELTAVQNDLNVIDGQMRDMHKAMGSRKDTTMSEDEKSRMNQLQSRRNTIAAHRDDVIRRMNTPPQGSPDANQTPTPAPAQAPPVAQAPASPAQSQPRQIRNGQTGRVAILGPDGHYRDNRTQEVVR